MKLLKLTQWIDKNKTQPILINADSIQSIEIVEHNDPVPILGQSRTTHLTHVLFKGGTQGRLVTESLEEVERLYSLMESKTGSGFNTAGNHPPRIKDARDVPDLVPLQSSARDVPDLVPLQASFVDSTISFVD